ncbi:hypothetical protein C8J47_3687 [Sphingomonas sp. PP-F2F-G114-C0414]|uniref:hypothetical protein n=1 Tax=Sphingomonas sp. PP-F2F-G114-C0414 TaxID=2135662 RepID=UPI000EF8D007|nr:hypothetical protein [Sphingomonas sp. PP-F2F-G114-C0414]RMB25738.1 hypothetical protein C8J47_3687 [Sphingomonas sp. PP-F2F-G114-C0414]
MADQGRLKSDATEQLRELSEMAHRGRSSIVNTGPIMLIWGAAIVTAALAERLSRHSVYTVAAWIVPVLLAYLASLFAIRLARSDSRAVTWRSRAIHRVWVVAGAAIIVFNVGEELHRSSLQSESEAATALILAVAAMATGELANRKAFSYIGVSWMIVAFILLSVVADMPLLLLLAFAAVVLQIVPGLLLLREEWKA